MKLESGLHLELDLTLLHIRVMIFFTPKYNFSQTKARSLIPCDLFIYSNNLFMGGMRAFHVSHIHRCLSFSQPGLASFATDAIESTQLSKGLSTCLARSACGPDSNTNRTLSALGIFHHRAYFSS